MKKRKQLRPVQGFDRVPMFTRGAIIRRCLSKICSMRETLTFRPQRANSEQVGASGEHGRLGNRRHAHWYPSCAVARAGAACRRSKLACSRWGE
jgi:hypothetical protein